MFRTMRRQQKAISEFECKEILQKQRRGVLALLGDDGYPYAIPINYFFDESQNMIYFHGSKVGHKIDAIKRNDKVCFTVLGDSTYKENQWAPYTSSVVIFGRCSVIDNMEKTEKKVRQLALKYYPTNQEAEDELQRSLQAVQLYEISIEHISGKWVQEK